MYQPPSAPVITLKKHECGNCFEPLAGEEVVTLLQMNGKSCGHYIHKRCAYQLNDKRCPHCQIRFEQVDTLPSLSKPDAWFAAVDVNNDGWLSYDEVTNALLATCTDVDPERFKSSMQNLWHRWDLNGDGRITYDEIFNEPDGLLAYARAYCCPQKFINNESPQLNHRPEWFNYWDEDHSESLDKAEVYRALIKTFNLGRDAEAMRTMQECIDCVWPIFDADGNGTISFEEFTMTDGLGQTLSANLQHMEQKHKGDSKMPTPTAQVVNTTTSSPSDNLPFASVVTDNTSALPSPPDPPSSLPPGWQQLRAPDGRSYYVDHTTQTTHWEPPPSYSL
uniref:Calmodulin n=1 Tax=Aureoumbra lagunensis TaxID=44058 RepID=A0A7S3NIQ5_9STRA|mmetsp:Transcript_9447/g.14535  ORF Transcript_9447/g.14535 Transcript_9447/m.14535 type:complete len:335 (-) Transcript_9447:148-1152(-)